METSFVVHAGQLVVSGSSEVLKFTPNFNPDDIAEALSGGQRVTPPHRHSPTDAQSNPLPELAGNADRYGDIPGGLGQEQALSLGSSTSMWPPRRRRSASRRSWRPSSSRLPAGWRSTRSSAPCPGR